MSKKKHHHEEHEEHVNHEAWVIPYADMLTLLMALFLVMWATSQTDVNKMKQVAAGFADSLGIQGNGQGVGGNGIFDGAATVQKPDATIDIIPKQDKAEAALQLQQQTAAAEAEAKKQLEGIQQQITSNAQQNGVAGELAFKDEGRGLVVSIVSEGVLFDAGSADLRPEGRAVLDGLADTLNSTPNKLSIEGHTDDRPISTARFPSNWELSTARAAAVLRYLVDVHHMDPKRLSASGYGDQQPSVPNVDDASRAKNRRVDIAILSEPVTTGTDPKGTP
ncbi:MAG: flagellar motor protein MotB [Acidimicrobiales bacterium]